MTREARKGVAGQRDFAVVQEATGQAEIVETVQKEPQAVARGRAGGLARAEKLTPERRREIALNARVSRRRG